MLIDDLKLTAQNCRNKNKLFGRTQLKEAVQNYILNFIYNDKIYKEFIFTGGTCLRKVYGLPRLSEDLDFDYVKTFRIVDFSDRLAAYFKETLQYKDVETKIAGHQRTVFLKFPKLMGENQTLFVRCDFAHAADVDFGTTINAMSAADFSFFALSFDLPTLFANKIIAFLERKFFKGSQQEMSFKGRDLFDISWLLSESAKTGYSLQPRWSRLFTAFGGTDKKKIVDLVKEKIDKVKYRDLVTDLYPFIESESTIETFGKNFKEIVGEKLDRLWKDSH